METPSSASTSGKHRICLPRNVIPSHYDLIIDTDLETFTFQGQVKITLDVHSLTKAITVNALDLDIHSATIDDHSAIDIEFEKKHQTVTFKFKNEWQVGQTLTLSIIYQGVVNEFMAGYYRSSYTNEKGAKKYMAVTQFEAVDARRALPCFDEPDLKATFDVTLLMSPHLSGLSNCDCIHNHVDGKRTMKFETTPKMSTYLLAFVVGEWDFVEATTVPTPHLPHPVRCRVYTPPGLSEQGQFALDIAMKTLDYFSKLFDIPYPLSKCDQIAIPDFSAGAMENWGLITYRTVSLLIDQVTGSIQYKKRIATTVTHELAHAWFGNLVTFKHWDELWLNEGFATWVGTHGATILFPEWDLWTLFLSEDQNYALTVDGVRASHPIQVEVLDPKEINQIFDAISYSKGASVIHMLTQWLTVDVFFKGLQVYLKKFQYKNASTEDLWKCLEQVSQQDVKAFMGVWTQKVGYPMIYVQEQDNQLVLKQARFLQTGDLTPIDDTTIWPVPLTLTTQETKFQALKQEVMWAKESLQPLPSSTSYLLNARRSGFFRVAYPEHRLKELIRDMAMLGVHDRMALYDDTYALARGGYLSIVPYLDMVQETFPSEPLTNYVLFKEVATSLSTLCHVWAYKQEHLTLIQLKRHLFTQHAAKLGFEVNPSETALQKLLRPLVLFQAGMAGDPEVLKEAQKRFQALQKTPATVPADLYRAILCMVVRSQPHLLEEVIHVYETTSNLDLRYAALTSLGYIQPKDKIELVLAYSIQVEKVRPQDLHYIWNTLSDNPAAWTLLWQFLQSNWDLLAGRYEGNFNMLGSCVALATQHETTQAGLDAILKFFETKDTKSFHRKLHESLDEIHANMAWLQRDREAVKKWIQSHPSLYQGA